MHLILVNAGPRKEEKQNVAVERKKYNEATNTPYINRHKRIFRFNYDYTYIFMSIKDLYMYKFFSYSYIVPSACVSKHINFPLHSTLEIFLSQNLNA